MYHRAKRVEDGKIVAFKVLEGPGITDEDRIRFIREVHIQSCLDHPNIVPILGSNFTVDPPFFVMPLANANLRNKLNDRVFEGNLKGSLDIFMQLLDAVAFAHLNGVIHRDLKPENILFFDEDILGSDIIRIADFGLGKRMDMESLTVTKSNVGMGTIAYMPPEQGMDFKRADHRADIYSLGKILYELLTTKLPLHVNTQHMNLPRGFGYVIGRCIEHDPDDRYASILELKKDIVELTADQKKFMHPQREIEILIQSLGAGHDESGKLIEQIDRIFLDNSDDETFYTKYFVKLDCIGIQEYLSYSATRFRERLKVFDSFVCGSLPWSYTDMVADFYKVVWGQTEDIYIRQIILRRLLNMGYSHNRWHVGSVFGELLKSISHEEEALVARDVLLENPGAAKWIRTYCEGGLLPVIRDAFLNDI